MLGKCFDIPALGAAALPSDPFENVRPPVLDREEVSGRANALTNHNGETLGEIYDMLGDLSFAIELAASWIPVVSPLDLSEYLRQADSALASNTALVTSVIAALRRGCI